jgi:lipopolysaccharide/colanic/teichoic acid biosynthesis glycosyltransferase
MQPVPEVRLPIAGLSIKRALDVVLAAALLVVLAPVEAAVALTVRLKLGRPVLFVQERPGRNAVPFKVPKFRTMTDARGPDGALLSDAQRLTSLGRVLRSTSLDELPQLINVMTGDMSFIGPRPLLMQYLPYFTARERLRFKVRPGITGWAQVNGRNSITWDQRLAHDIWYVEHWSLLLDLRIAVRTVGTIFARRGVEADPESTMANLDDQRTCRMARES